jgi:hypothetical protein
MMVLSIIFFLGVEAFLNTLGQFEIPCFKIFIFLLSMLPHTETQAHNTFRFPTSGKYGSESMFSNKKT